jgi:hypothetical protein
VKRKDDIEFKFNTALTASEAYSMGVKPELSRSNVINMTSGDAILSIVNNTTNETDKPEKFYVDSYWRELCDPRVIMTTTLCDNNGDIVQFNKYTFPYMTNKTFWVVKTERDVKNESINITLKERNI